MGQRIGKASLIEEMKPFANLSAEAIQECWDKFNEVAEGFGISLDIFKSVCSVTIEEIAEGDEDLLGAYAENCFRAFDTDENDLVDALEFLATFALLSAMDLPAKVKFMFDAYDFDESGQLTIDEMTLSLKSTITGLAKAGGIPSPSEQDLEALSQQAFKMADLDSDQKITFEEFRRYCLVNPEVRSFLDFYDDANEHWGTWDESHNKDLDAEQAEISSAIPSLRQELTDAGIDVAGIDARDLTALALAEGVGLAADRPWVAGSLKPPGLADEIDGSIPNEEVALDWVHGIRTADVRNSLLYNLDGDIVYFCGSICIVYNKTKNKQSHMTNHRADIVSIAMHPEGLTCASGEVGKKPRIIIWNTQTCEREHQLRGLLDNAVTHLAFSPDGTRLAAVGMDASHALVVYDWKKETALFQSYCGPNRVLDCQFVEQTRIVTCGVNNCTFWIGQRSSALYERKRGLFGQKFPKITLCCVDCIPAIAGKIATGTVTGKIYVWDGRKVQAAIDAHDGACTAIAATPTGVVTGGQDSRIILWSPELENLATFDVTAVTEKTCVRNELRSLAFSGDGSRILLAVSGAEAYELSVSDGSDVNGGALVKGHARGQLWGVAAHPQKPEYVTVGDDGTVRVWSIEKKKCLRMARMSGSLRAVCYSPDGTRLCVGVGSPDEASDVDGTFRILNEQNLQVIYESKDAEGWITCVAWSPDGDTLAIASADSNIYLYNNDDYAAKGRCGGREEGQIPLRLDFTEDAQYLRSSCTAQRLLYHSAATGEHKVNGAKELRMVDWATQDTPIGWMVQGFWPSLDDGVQITACSLSRDEETASDERVIAKVDSVGRLMIFNYPVPAPDQDGNGGGVPIEARGHSGCAQNVCWSFNDKAIMTVGRDRCVMQWRHEIDLVEESAEFEQEVLEMYDEIEAVSAALSVEVEAKTIGDVEWADAAEEKSDDPEAFMAAKPWWRYAVSPSNTDAEAEDVASISAPPSDVRLDWVYGSDAPDCRGTVVYLHGNEIAFNAGNVLVVMNQGEHRQRFGFAHQRAIVSLCVHPDGITVATGEVGRRPSIILWDTKAMKPRKILTGLHRMDIRRLAFSPDGTKLLSGSQDVNHTLGIWDVKTGELLNFVRGGTMKIMDLAWQSNSAGFVQAGLLHIKFHTIRGRNICTKVGIFGEDKGNICTIMCVGCAGDFVVGGTAQGNLYRFDGRSLDVVRKGAHEGLINVMYAGDDRVITGGYDGKCRVWSVPDLDLVGDLNVAALGSFIPIVQSVCLSSKGDTVLVATKAAEIFEMEIQEGKNAHGEGKGPLVTGHCENAVHGIALHPNKPHIVATGGDDATLRLWDLEKNVLVNMVKLDCLIRAVCFSPDGNYLAVGLGGEIPGKDVEGPIGGFKVIQEEDLAIAAEPSPDARSWITDIKYSPDGRTLALASMDSNIYLYEVDDGYKLLNTYKKPEGAVTHFDFSVDSTFMRVNDKYSTGDGMLTFADATTGRFIPSAEELRDVEWQTNSCTLSWPTRGLHEPLDDGSNSVVLSIAHAPSASILASVDSIGYLKLWTYPATSIGAGSKSILAHTSSATGVVWAQNEDTLLTLGGNDRCVKKWVRINVPSDSDAMDYELKQTDGTPLDMSFGLTSARQIEGASAEEKREQPANAWLGTIVDPSAPPAHDGQAPKITLQLEHIYGYGGVNARDNVYFSSLDEIVYSAARVGVVYTKALHSQRFFSAHSSEIICMAMDDSGRFVASSERDMKSRVRLWATSTCVEVSALQRAAKGFVTCMAFSSTSQRLCTVTAGPKNFTVAVYTDVSESVDWSSTSLVAKQVVGSDPVLCCKFLGKASSSLGFNLFTGGQSLPFFWKQSGQSLAATRGLFDRAAKRQPQLCAEILGDALITGTANGNIYMWEGSRVARVVPAHRSMIASMHAIDCEKLVTGSRDGVVKVWDRTLECIRTFDLKQAAPNSLVMQIRAVRFNSALTKVVVGTAACELYEICYTSGSTTLLTEGPCKGETWGLATHPKDARLLATTGDDRYVRVWDCEDKMQVSRANVDSEARAVSWSPAGDLLGVGTGAKSEEENADDKAGAIVMVNAESMEIVHEGRDSRMWVQDCKFSPDGKLFAIAAHDNQVLVYDIAAGFKLKTTLNKHQAGVTHFDFSADSAYIRSNCLGRELHYFKADSGEYMATGGAELKDEEWATSNCEYSWGTKGLWTGVDNARTEANAVDVSPDGKLLAVVDESGYLQVFKNPCVDEGAAAISKAGHTKHCTNVKFSCDGKRVFTVGGDDNCLFAWKVTR
eukprot:g4459.t1